MFTIKHVDDSGEESLFTAEWPAFHNGKFTYKNSSGETQVIGYGVVYVMNGNGSTVATYRPKISASDAYDLAVKQGGYSANMKPPPSKSITERWNEAWEQGRVSVHGYDVLNNNPKD